MNKVCLACEFERRTQDQDPCAACIEFEQFVPKDSQPVKTLLDEFAMAAMKEIIAKRPYLIALGNDEVELANKIVSADCQGAWAYAKAMMRERSRRDEMGNVKEVE